MSIDDCCHNGQPEAGAATLRRIWRPLPACVAPGKSLEDATGHFGGYAGSVIGHGDKPLRAVDPNVGTHLGAGWGVGPRVCQQVDHHLIEPVLITLGDHRVLRKIELPYMIGTGRAGITDSVDHNLTQVTRLEIKSRSGIQAR